MKKIDLITLTEARRILGVSRMKVWRLVKDGTLTAISNPLDKRQKLVHRLEVEALVLNTEARAA
jgi:excisionase family DNA binding protein